MKLFGGVSFVEKLFFTKHLSVMLKSGITLSEGVQILKEQTRSNNFKKILAQVESDLVNGESLAKSLGKFPQVFDYLYVAMIEAGEESGNLEDNLDYLSKELSKSYEFKKKVKGALLYPTIILIVLGVVIAILSIFVLPQMVELFKSLNVELPWTTRLLLWIAGFMKTWGILFFAFVFVLIVVFMFAIKTTLIRPFWNRFVLHIPVIGEMSQYVEIANICRTLGIMLRSGLPITTAIKATHESTENSIFRQYLENLRETVSAGVSLETELSNKKYKYIPRIVSRMIGVGERTGKLDESLIYLGDFYTEEVDDLVKNLPTVIEPALLVVMAGVVGFVAFSIISPIYQFTGSIHR